MNILKDNTSWRLIHLICEHTISTAYHVLDDKKEFLAVRQRGESSRSDSEDSRNFKWKKIQRTPLRSDQAFGFYGPPLRSVRSLAYILQ
jgi:hypothetical protein